MDKLRGEVALKTESENDRAKMAEEAIAKAIGDHKLYAAEHFATRDDAAEGLQRVEDELHRMSDRIDKYHTTLLEALVNRPAAPVTRPRGG